MISILRFMGFLVCMGIAMLSIFVPASPPPAALLWMAIAYSVFMGANKE